MLPLRSMALVALAALMTSSCSNEASLPLAYLSVEPTYVGGGSCETCHEEEFSRWRGSHHDLAMQEVSTQTVLGDFDDVVFEHRGVISTFSRQGDEYWVRTEGPDGELEDYRVDYVFGVEPLQQYLIEFPGGRYQVLPLCWDTRAAEVGGQRWFHLYPDEHIPPGDFLHWTGPNQNWNYMCAECHSTDLRKGYDLASNSYETTWEEINVSCEACHGPGARHLAWAEAVEAGEAKASDRDGLMLRLKDADDAAWTFDETGIARRQPQRVLQRQLDTCARCHSRRSVTSDPYVHGRPLLDTHRASLLEAGLYHPDGQILDEVYVYGSFLQSRMYAEGVTCSDCHDPHSLELWNDGNAACATCHLPARFDTEEHHRHRVGSEGSGCVDCHMRSETYMVVDPRHDHSFRVPRPDLSLELGTPNACTDCHRETTPAWAAERFAEWWPERVDRAHYGQALKRGRDGGISATADLVSLIADPVQPAIVRATAIELLTSRLGERISAPIERAVRDPDPMVRAAAGASLGSLDPQTAMRLGRPLLDDPVLGVRIAAVRPMLQLPAEVFAPEDGPVVAAAAEELRQTQRVNADRPEAHITLGALHAQAGELEAALAEYRQAMEIDPENVEARINLADLYRQMGDEVRAEEALREALSIRPDDHAVLYALGLALVRQGRTTEAILSLEKAATLEPTNLRYGYVLAVAVHSTGRIPGAIKLLKVLHERWPENREVLVALASYHAQLGGLAEAEAYARKLVAIAPGDSQAQAFLQQFTARRQQ